ncbi:MAG: ribonuclease J [Alphaproteobacteria bacterium GM7ARS4]|nr:ribonuclease J [Alphaproteobacteria bacterium GM7ARS4]
MVDARLPTPDDKGMLFVPLGGLGEIGMNCALYGYKGKWLGVDLGVTFGDGRTLGIDVIVPQLDVLLPHKDSLLGFVLTHGHEDHIGAIPYVWDMLGRPRLWANPLTATLIERKLKDAGLYRKGGLNVVEAGQRFSVEDFRVQMIGVNHSIPQSCALMIETDYGRMIHSGDWYFDSEPLKAPKESQQALRRVADKDGGILALMCDSTNVFEEKHHGTEAGLREAFVSLIKEYEGRRIIFTCFASNITRIESIAKAALSNKRHPVLVGRSMYRYHQAALRHKSIEDIMFLGEEEGARMERGMVVYICTGSQGEPRAVMSRLAYGGHDKVRLEEGDVVVFSSRVIPGNEKAVGDIYNRFRAQGIHMVDSESRFVHVSGHPPRCDLAAMYDVVSPRFIVPVHGEDRHLLAHKEFAEEKGYKTPSSHVRNGSVVCLSKEKAEVIGSVPYGRRGVYGGSLVMLDSKTVAHKQSLFERAFVHMVVAVDDEGRLRDDIVFHAPTMWYHEGDNEKHMAQWRHKVERAYDAIDGSARSHDVLLRNLLREALSKIIKKQNRLNPVIDVSIMRV